MDATNNTPAVLAESLRSIRRCASQTFVHQPTGEPGYSAHFTASGIGVVTDAADMLLKQEAEIERLRAELAAPRAQEPESPSESHDYLTVVYRVQHGDEARAILGAREWCASSRSHALHDRDDARRKLSAPRAPLTDAAKPHQDSDVEAGICDELPSERGADPDRRGVGRTERGPRHRNERRCSMSAFFIWLAGPALAGAAPPTAARGAWEPMAECDSPALCRVHRQCAGRYGTQAICTAPAERITDWSAA